MKVLFVDDEPNILQGIERMLIHLSDSWDIMTAESGKEALEELAEENYDVIVTNMRMPGMDGAALLREVHDRHPDVIRIVLSGHAELEAAMRAIPVAHQFLTKPTSGETIENVIRRMADLRELLQNDLLRETIGHIDRLPSVPRLYAEMTKILADPTADAQDVAAVVNQDPAMCAKILQLVNSGYFFRGMDCTDITQAVMRLGFQTVKNLALSVEVFRSPEGLENCPGFSIEELQSHAMKAATIAARLIEDRRASEDAFMAAMLHDAGKLILASEFGDKYRESLDLVRTGDLSAHEAERKILGTTHAEIGAYLFGTWGLPYPIVEAVANHHEPGRVRHEGGLDVLGAVHVADRLSRGLEPDPAFLEAAGIAGSLESWKATAAAVEASEDLAA